MERGGVARILGPDGEVVEVVIATPSAGAGLGRRRFSADALRAELEVYAPPSPEEVAEAAMRVAQEEYNEAEKLRTMCSTITTVTLALAQILRDHGLTAGETILIPRPDIDRWKGSKLGISETADHDVVLRFRPRAEDPITREEMRS